MSLSIREQVTELLGRNLFLEQAMRTRIESSDENVLKRILPTLIKIDEVQTKLIKSAMEKNPNFFGDLQNGITHEVLANIMREEIALHQQEVDEAEAELAKQLEILN